MNKPTRKKRWVGVRKPRGAPPGTLLIDPEAPWPVIQVLAYGPDKLAECKIGDPEAVREFLGKWPVTWLNVDGLGDAEAIIKIGRIFGIHPLALEDVTQVHHRAKVELYGEHLFIVAQMVAANPRLETEQLNLFLGKNFVLTFQQVPGDSLDPVRARLRNNAGSIRQEGPDHLAYSLLDAVVDGYYPVLEDVGERLERLEDEMLSRPDKAVLIPIHEAKRDLLILRRAVWPLREVFNSLIRDPLPLISNETRVYFRDCYDHAVLIMDLVEMYRELGSGLLDLYVSSMSNRMNEIIKVLTIITTIFIPMSFIAGIYGMNFELMPEIRWKWGYPLALGLMAVTAIGMLIFFVKKGWLGYDAIREKRRGRNDEE